MKSAKNAKAANQTNNEFIEALNDLARERHIDREMLFTAIETALVAAYKRNYENNGGYNPMDIYNSDADIRRVVNQLVDGTYSQGDKEMYRDLYNSLLTVQGGSKADTYFILKDFRSYADTQKKVEEAYRDKDRWAKMALLNTASCGKFSSDRTIQEYVDDIWHLDKVTVEV